MGSATNGDAAGGHRHRETADGVRRRQPGGGGAAELATEGDEARARGPGYDPERIDDAALFGGRGEGEGGGWQGEGRVEDLEVCRKVLWVLCGVIDGRESFSFTRNLWRSGRSYNYPLP